MNAHQLAPEHPSRTAALVFTGLAVLMGIHLFVRAFAVPITYEEATRFFTLVQQPGIATDHVLSVLWSKLCSLVLGPALVPQRFLALLSFGLFARYAYLLGTLVRDKLVRWCLWAALLIMPFAVELFALAGGQALAMAFLLMGLWHLSRIPEEPGLRPVVWASLAFVGVALSTAFMLPAWAIGELAVLVALLRAGGATRWKRLALWAALAIAPGVLLFLGHATEDTGFELQLAQVLRKWSLLVFGTHAQWLVWTLVLSVACMAVLAIWRMHGKERGVLLTLVVLLVLWPVLGILLLQPQDLLHDLLAWLPLFLLGWALALDHAARDATHRRWLALLLLLPVVHMLAGIHVGTTRSSGDGAIPPNMAETVQRIQAESTHPLVLGGGVRQSAGWNFGRLFDEVPLSSLQTDHSARETADLLLLSRPEADDVSGKYSTIQQGPGGLTLVQRTVPFAYTLLRDTALAFPLSDAEYMELPMPPLEDLLERAISFDLVAVVAAERQARRGPYLIIEVNDANMDHLYYASRDVHLIPGQHDKPIRITHALPTVPPEAQRVAIYIWNPARVPLKVDAASLRIMQRDDPHQQATE